MKSQLFNIQYISIFLLLLIFSTTACNHDDDYIPYVMVDFVLDLNIKNELCTTGYSEKFTNEGYAGVIVFCETYDPITPTASIYYAYDAACTFELSDTCSVENRGNGVMAICPCCGSEYYLYGGYPYKGEAAASLKMYKVAILNNKLRVYN